MVSAESRDQASSVQERCILHLDMDAFFASIEQVDRPELKGLPVIVGGRSDRSVVSTASYEARRFGVRSAMPMVQARKLCPKGVYLPVRMERYAEISRVIMAVVSTISPQVEQASVDEAYADITGNERLFGPPRELAGLLKARILETTALTCSVGIAPNKFLAKVASDFQKPDGLTVIAPDQVKEFLAHLPVGKIPGVGKKTLETLKGLAVRAAGDVLRYPRSFWESRMGKWGGCLHDRAGGIDNRPVQSGAETKSVSAERTFDQDTRDVEVMTTMLLRQAERVGRELRREGLKGRTVTLKVKYSDHQLITRASTLVQPTQGTETIYRTALGLLRDIPLLRKVRLVGVGVSNFQAETNQLSLFGPDGSDQDDLDRVLDRIQDRFGSTAIVRGKLYRGGEG